MSAENVEIVRRIWEAWARRDGDAALVLHDPEVEVIASFQPEGLSTYRGHEGIGRWVRQWMEQFDDVVADPEEFTDAGERVVVRIRHRGRGRGSSASVETLTWRVYMLRNGRVARIEDFSASAKHWRPRGCGSSRTHGVGDVDL